MSICWSQLKMKGLIVGSHDCHWGEMKENTTSSIQGGEQAT